MALSDCRSDLLMIGNAFLSALIEHTDSASLKQVHLDLAASTYAPRARILHVTLTASHRNKCRPLPKITLKDLCQNSKKLTNLWVQLLNNSDLHIRRWLPVIPDQRQEISVSLVILVQVLVSVDIRRAWFHLYGYRLPDRYCGGPNFSCCGWVAGWIVDRRNLFLGAILANSRIEQRPECR